MRARLLPVALAALLLHACAGQEPPPPPPGAIPAGERIGSATISGVGAVFLETQHTTNASSICSGDSGGPLMLHEGGRWAVAGISSAASVATCNTGTNFYVNIRNPTVMSYILDLVPEAGRR